MTAPARPRAPRLLSIGELPEPLVLRESPRAQRLSLRVVAARGLIEVVVPLGVSEAEALRFVGRHRAWIHHRQAALPKRLPFVDGATVPLLGVDHVIRHHPEGPRTVTQAAGELRLGGPAEHLPRRVHDWLERRARQELAARVAVTAGVLGATVSQVTVRDTRSRWGSCSSAGRLSFSWRLVLAPEAVIDYVVAHEVAHLQEMNHSPRFWQLVARLVPELGPPRAWLKAHGAQLLRYG